jgi:putative hemolysin
VIQLEPGYALTYSLLLSGITTNPPDIKIIAGFIFLLILLFASAIISASEVAYFSLSTEDTESIRLKNTKRSDTVIRLSEIPERLLGTILVATNTLNVIIVLLAAFLSTAIFDFSTNPMSGFIIDAAVIIFLLLLPGEILAKKYASKNNAQLALIMAFPLALLEKILWPLTSLVIFSSSAMKRRTNTFRTNISIDELSGALEQNSHAFDEDGKILKGIVNFGNINVSAIMCPRIDVTAVDIRSGFSQVIPVIINSGFSRIPVYSESFDNVKGILYAKDVLPYMNNPGNFKWQSLLRNPYFVPETKKINDLLKEFQLKKIHMAVVIDEYGGTSGIVTLEDILEEIVGEITDESDTDEVLYRKIDERTFVFEGKVLLNDLIKVLNLEKNPFEDVRGESETLAGLILELTGEIPQQDQIIRYKNFIFTIESADRRRIMEIRVETNADNDKPEKE